jgi:hypothetical protein
MLRSRIRGSLSDDGIYSVEKKCKVNRTLNPQYNNGKSRIGVDSLKNVSLIRPGKNQTEKRRNRFEKACS